MQNKSTEPTPSKRCKLAEDTTFQIKAILPNEYTETSLETVYSINIKEKQQISHYMQELSQHLPLTTLQHLKRVRGSEIVLCRKKEIGEGLTLKEFLSQTSLSEEAVEVLCKSVTEIEVPASACKLRWQYDLMRSHWPCKFHPDKYLESLYNGTCFTNSEMDFHKRIAGLLLKLSQDLESNRPCGLCVDPRTNSIVCIAASRTEINPLYHCAMVMVDYVARTQSPCVLNEQFTENFVENSAKKGLKGGERTLAGLLQKYKDYIQQNVDYRTLEMGAELIKLKDKLTGEHVFEAGLDNLTRYGPYLCTGYDIYVTDEPCLMCSMALVHSRARRVFFIRQSTGNGALLTNFKLQAVKELNHHYEVFQCCAS